MLRPEASFDPATEQDMIALSRCLRDQDQAELRACGEPDFESILLSSLRVSDWVVSVRVGGQYACALGVTPSGTLLAPAGSPWMLGTDLVATSKRVLARYAPAYIARMHQDYPTLHNVVHLANTVSVRWLQRVGFALGESFSHPRTGELFAPFWSHR